MTQQSSAAPFFGWRVMWAAFAVAIFGWGTGFYGPPVFLHVLTTGRHWPLATVSAAVTVHFLTSALCIANMPRAYRRFGVAMVTKACALSAALGLLAWSLAFEPWQLFVAAIPSGLGWAGTGALGINMMLAPWFETLRPKALSIAYNGASIGGVVFSPLWIALISRFGFPMAAAMVGGAMAVLLWTLSAKVFSVTPADIGTGPDGAAPAASNMRPARREPPILPGRALWVSRAFVTYAGGFAIGLFVQVGIIAHLVSLMVPALGAQGAGLAAGFATACAILGRTLAGWFLPANADRRVAAALTLCVQALGCGLFILSGGSSIPLLLAGVALFGLGIGNVTSLPPLIAQAEFARADVPRAIALGTAISQGAFAFAPVLFGLARAAAGSGSGEAVFFTAAVATQLIAAAVYLAGRRTSVAAGTG